MENIFKGRIRDLSSKGFGVIDHPEGLVFFVPGTWPGDLGTFEIQSTEKRYGFARLVELIEPSPDRVSPVPCTHQGYETGKCGGCPWMIGSYSSQIKYKQKFIEYQVERAQFTYQITKIHPIWPSDKNLGYRNRAQLKTDGNQIGFVSVGSRDIAPIQDCLVLTDKNRNTLKTLIDNLPNPNWVPHGKHQWNFFDLDEDLNPNDIVLNKRRPFRQGNSFQNQKMKEWLKKLMLPIDRNKNILELFCGSGNFTRVISDLGFNKITAVEVSGDAIENLRAQELPHVETLACNLESQKSFQTIQQHMPDPQILLLDPPRTGFSDLHQLVKNFPSLEMIVYISCDVVSFLTDAKKLEKTGWKILEIQPLDQFPNTTHTELLSIIMKDSSSLK